MPALFEYTGFAAVLNKVPLARHSYDIALTAVEVFVKVTLVPLTELVNQALHVGVVLLPTCWQILSVHWLKVSRMNKQTM